MSEISDRRRRQMVQAAIEVMAQKGWEHTSISEVTKQAGVSRGLASYHFRDKSELLEGVLVECRELFTHAVLRGTAEGDPPAQLRRIIRLAIEQVRSEPVVFQVFLHFAAAEPANPELGDEIRALWRDFRGVAAEGIRAGQREGAYRAEIDPDAAAAQLIGGIVGIALQWLLDPESFDLAAAGQLLEEQYMADLTGQQGSGARVDPARPD